MIVWLNGTFGAGKTTAAQELLDLLPGSTLYDPELLGQGLRMMLPAKRLEEIDDLQDLPAWRRLVVDTAAALLTEVPGPLVTPMTLLRQEYRDEIFGALAARRIQVRHFLLDAEETILRERIAHREETAADRASAAQVRRWGLDALTLYAEAMSWLKGDAYVVDTGRLTPRRAAEEIAEAVRSGTADCGIVQTPEPTAETLAAGVLLFDDADRFLLVDPTYKPGWEFPGGIVEHGEPPTQAGLREVVEELALRLPRTPRLLVLDWEAPEPPGFGGLRLLFDGGRLTDEQTRGVRLPGAELREWRFVTESEAEHLLPPVRFRRLRWALRARERGCPMLLERGVPAGG
ncbi:NUDIX domain-containing protein [Streptomyces sp. NPDC059080]|uniref:NUDIX hydrolase n=1 Tax=Streptomyces sp. NPDC059080 TaxID=3346718 RepID=UPI0036CDDE9D